MAINTKTIESKKAATKNVRQATTSGKFSTTNGSSTKVKSLTKADLLTLQAWKKTYESHQKKAE